LGGVVFMATSDAEVSAISDVGWAEANVAHQSDSYRLLKPHHIYRQTCGWLYPRRRQPLHRFIDSGIKVFFSALLTYSGWDTLNNLELAPPAKIDINLLLFHLSLTKITLSHNIVTFACGLSIGRSSL